MTRNFIGNAAMAGVIAGLAGGTAEVVWIWLYGTITGNDAGLVARAVTDAVGVDSHWLSPVYLGLAIHMTLAAALGVALATAIRFAPGRLPSVGVSTMVIAALAIVWAANFFVVLPLISPEFVTIVPLEVSFLSKLLFGVAAAGFFQFARFSRRNLVPA